MLWWALLLGMVWAVRRLGVGSAGEAVPLGLALGHLGLLLAANLGWWAVPTALLVLTVAAWPRPVSPQAQPPLPAAMLWLALLAGGLAAVLQARFVDDDYWIHSPTQALLLQGERPPRHFFFADVTLRGHYGRDLLVAAYSRLTGWSVFTGQFALTTLLQPVTILILYWAFFHLHGSRSAQSATLMLAAGVQVAGRCGLLAVVQNNNAPLHAWWALVLYAFARTWKERRTAWAVLLGLSLGSLALVYETHFALSALACLVTLAWGCTWLPQRGGLLRPALITVTLACALAFTQGGPLTELVRPHSAPTGLGQVSQTQHVRLTFPKRRLGQLRCRREANRRVERWSEGLEVEVSARMTDPEAGYAPFWDGLVLGLQSLPFWLSPVVLVWALRQRQVLAVWLLAFAGCAFATPLLVDFGPIFESEYLRWQFAAGLGCAGALGLALRRRWWPLVLLYLAAGRLTLDGPGPWLYRGARHWVTHQPVLDFSESDWTAAEWLRGEGRPGQTVLTHPLARPHQVSFESTLCGLTGLLASRRLPLADDEVGLVPSRQRPDVACFLASGDPDFLALTRADWLWWRRGEPPRNAGLHWSYPAGAEGPGLARLEVDRPGWPLTPAPAMEVKVEGLPRRAEEGKIYPLRLPGLFAPLPSPPGQGRLVLGDGEDRIPCGRQPLWLAPHRAGHYRVPIYWWDRQGLHPAGSFEVEVDTLGQMRRFEPQIQAIEIQPSGKFDGWGVVTVELKVPFQDRSDWYAAARFGSNPAELEPLAIDRVSPAVWRWHNRVLLPPGPGRYPIELWLSPFHGSVIRLRGPELDIGPEFYPGVE